MNDRNHKIEAADRLADAAERLLDLVDDYREAEEAEALRRAVRAYKDTLEPADRERAITRMQHLFVEVVHAGKATS